MTLRHRVSIAARLLTEAEDSSTAARRPHSMTAPPEPPSEMKVLRQSNPTDNFGVAVARVTFAKGTFMAGIADHHMIGIGCSKATPVEHMIDGKRIQHHIAPGSLCLCPAGARHSTLFSSAMSGIVLRVSPECLALASAEHLGRNFDLIEQINGRDGFIAHVAHVLDAEATAGHPNGMLFWHNVTDALFTHLVRHHLARRPTPQSGPLAPAAIDRVNSFIRENLSEPLTLDSLSAVAGCPRFQFARSFQTTVGISPHRYVVRRRLECARAMIHARQGSLAEISVATGFTDQSHMTRWIKRVYGATPAQLVA